MRPLRRRAQRGQALAETAITATLVLLLLLAAGQFAGVVFDQMAAQSAAFDAARAAAEQPRASALFPAPVTHTCTGTSDTNPVCQAMYNSLQQSHHGLLSPSSFSGRVTSAVYAGDTATCGGLAGSADDGTVTVTVSYPAPIFVPLVGALIADPHSGVRTVRATVVARIEPCDVNQGH